jgi:hypothetical protein
MGSYINQAKQTIKDISNTVGADHNISVHFGLVSFRDHPPQGIISLKIFNNY